MASVFLNYKLLQRDIFADILLRTMAVFEGGSTLRTVLHVNSIQMITKIMYIFLPRWTFLKFYSKNVNDLLC